MQLNENQVNGIKAGLAEIMQGCSTLIRTLTMAGIPEKDKYPNGRPKPGEIIEVEEGGIKASQKILGHHWKAVGINTFHCDHCKAVRKGMEQPQPGICEARPEIHL